MNEIEFLEDEDFYNELKELEIEINNIDLHVEELFETADILEGIKELLKSFLENNKSLKNTILTLDENKANYFLKGTLLCGLMSAYEGIAHQLIKILFNSELLTRFKDVENFDVAIMKDKLSLTDSKIKSIDNLKELLLKRTKNKPSRVAKILNSVFDLKVPEFSEKQFDKLISMRNSFTHKGGLTDAGYKYKIDKDYLIKLQVALDALVADYVNKLIDLLKEKLDMK